MTIWAPCGKMIFLAEFFSFSFELYGMLGYNSEGLGDASQRTKLYVRMQYRKFAPSTVRD